jgi:acetyltransferase-like isoleucine patch superfamily enzyme
MGTNGNDIDRHELAALLARLGAPAALLDLLPAEELLPHLLKDLPGETGRALRSQWYGRLFAGLGDGCTIGAGVTFERPRAITIGPAVRIQDRVHLDAAAGHGIEFGERCAICFGSYLTVHGRDGFIRIGARSYVGAGSQIFGHRGVTIGSQVLAAPGLMIVPYQHAFSDTNRPIAEQGGEAKPVVIEDDVYLGMGVRVLLGVSIGRGSVIGAGAVVTRDVPPYTVAAGVPARPVRSRRPDSSPAGDFTRPAE